MSWNNFYNRQIQLFGEKKQRLLGEKSVAIIGCGGLGCSLGLALGSAGLSHIDLVDFDTIALHNIHRQIGFTRDDVDQNKAECLQRLLEKRIFDTQIKSFPEDFETYAIRQRPVHLILDATDNLPTRTKIEAHAKSANTPWLYTSVEEWHGQMCLFQKAEFAANINISDRKPGGIAPPIVMLLAAFEANFALRFLLEESVETDTLHYLHFSPQGEFQVQKFKLG